MGKKDIFEDMKRQTGCDYISDLPKLPVSVLRASVQSLPGGDYTTRQWQELTQYLTGSSKERESAEEEKRSLRQRLA